MDELKKFWHNKNVLVTGHTGFKGSWLSIWLKHLGSSVYGFSHDLEVSKPNLFSLIDNPANCDLIGDINDSKKLSKFIKDISPEVIFHLAAQPLVRDSYLFPVETFKTNIIGTINLLDILREIDTVKSIIVVTSDKCYLNNENGIPFNEDDPLGGFDPYSSSKACAEHVSKAYYESFFKEMNVGVATVRAGNIIGGGDWAKDRIIPDAVKSWSSGKDLILRSPKSVRPWQNVLEPIFGYLLLAQKLHNDFKKYSSSWNFGPESENFITVENLIHRACKIWDNAGYKIQENAQLYESKHLTLDSSKSKKFLNWEPLLGIEKTIEITINWYKQYYSENTSSYNHSIDLIEKYINLYNGKIGFRNE